MSSEKTFVEQAPGAIGMDRAHPAAAHPRIMDFDKAIVEILPPRRKIALVGFASSTRDLAPFTDLGWEIWGMNQLYRHIPRLDRQFDIHGNWREDNVEGTDHPKWLAECGIPVYMKEREPSVPTALAYPLELVVERVAGTKYFTSTVAYMIGLAILEIDRMVERDPMLTGELRDDASVHEVGLAVQRAYARYALGVYGIDLIVGTEYDYQKACVEYLLGVAHGRGIEVIIPNDSALLKASHLYGFEKEPNFGVLKLTDFQGRAAHLGKQKNQLLANLATIDGALQEAEYWLQVLTLRMRQGKSL